MTVGKERWTVTSAGRLIATRTQARPSQLYGKPII